MESPTCYGANYPIPNEILDDPKALKALEQRSIALLLIDMSDANLEPIGEISVARITQTATNTEYFSIQVESCRIQ